MPVSKASAGSGFDDEVIAKMSEFLRPLLNPEDWTRFLQIMQDPTTAEITGKTAMDRLPPNIRRQALDVILELDALRAQRFRSRWGDLADRIGHAG